MNDTPQYHPDFVGAYSDRGPVRPGNEDAYWIPEANTPIEWGALYLVADGVGGQEDGAAAAQLAVLMVRDSFYRSRENGRDIPTAIHRAILRANEAIYDEAQSRGGGKMGCTFVAVVQYQNELHVAHVGDARAYLLRQDKLYRLTKDDTWVQKQVEEGLISPQDAAKHELRNIVTQVLGNKPEVEVNHRQHTLQTGDTFLLCSDGLHDVLSNSQMKEILHTQSSAKSAYSLVQAAIAAETKDNITAVVVQTAHNDAPALVPAASSHRSSRPRWILYLVAGLLVLLLVAVLLWMVLGRGQLDVGVVGSQPTRIGLAGGDGAATAVTTPLPTSTSSSLDAAQPTSTFAPSATSSPSATSTPVATSTPSPTPPIHACVEGLAFVWTDTQVNVRQCSEFAESQFNPGTEVIILQLTPISVPGPARDDNPACADTLNNFIKVRALPPSQVEGWILVSTMNVMQSGESCAP